MSKNVEIHEAAVIGGGPAGATVAILMARAGRDVILIEKERFAHDKVCGEFISWEAAHYLNRLGIDLHSLGAQSVENLRIVDGERVLNASLPFPAWSLSRRTLDEALLIKAGKEGAKIMRGNSVTSLTPRENIWVLETADQNILHANTVFLASGKHEVRGWRRGKSKAQDLIGFKMHFRLTPLQYAALRGSVEIFLFNGGYAGLELVEDGHANLCFLIKKDVYAKCGKHWPDLLAWMADAVPQLAIRLRDAVPVWPRPLAVYGIPYGYIYKSSIENPGLFRLGDQMAVIPSFAGDGIAIALHSAFIAESSYQTGIGSEDYHRLMRRSVHSPIRNAQMLDGFISNQLNRKIAFRLLRLLPNLMQRTIHGTRLRNRAMFLPKQFSQGDA